MDPIKKTARRAGLLYLLMGITSGFGIMYIPMNILVPGDPVATAQNKLNYFLAFDQRGEISRTFR